MARTRTGSFPIGFRRLGSDWQKDLDKTIAFAKDNRFEVIDTGQGDPAQLKKITAAGLRLGTVDLAQPWTDLLSPDASKRKDAVAAQAAYIKAAADAGAKVFFTVIIPTDHAARRKDNFALAVESYNALCQAIAPTGARIAIEGWPGGGPHYSSLCCTPADYRAFFKEVSSDVVGVNFDASHLIRMGIDPVRFVDEFGRRVYHVHGKDTALLDDERYEHGHLQPATFAEAHGFGQHAWRYTIPGHGCACWTRLLESLVKVGYRGPVCIELEDENYNGSEDGEKRGLIASHQYLEQV